VVRQLAEILRRAAVEAERDGGAAEDEVFDAVQNARVVRDAEAYYRTMFLGDVSSWNLRDRHMVITFETLVQHLTRRTGHPAKVVVWAHNSHLGDARATEMGDRGELNVGQLVRATYGHDTRLIGFTTHHGTVTAASDWDGPAERKKVRPALPDSYEAMFHATELPRFVLAWREGDAVTRRLPDTHLERAIGVVCRPDTERVSHYFTARLAKKFDAVVHFDETRAVEPLERTAEWSAGEPLTYPSGV
jgi:erythromycin esterase-like protein